MMRGGVTATRSNLKRVRNRLERVRKGASILRRKREALVVELFSRARQAMSARETIWERATAAYPALLRALALHGRVGLQALGWPVRNVVVELEWSQAWGVETAAIISRPPLRRSVAARGVAPGSAGPAAVVAAEEFEQLTELVLDGLSDELRVRRLADALSRTTRQVNTLDYRVDPALSRELTAIRRTLEEREREEQLRLRHLRTQRARR